MMKTKVHVRPAVRYVRTRVVRRKGSARTVEARAPHEAVPLLALIVEAQTWAALYLVFGCTGAAAASIAPRLRSAARSVDARVVDAPKPLAIGRSFA